MGANQYYAAAATGNIHWNTTPPHHSLPNLSRISKPIPRRWREATDTDADAGDTVVAAADAGEE